MSEETQAPDQPAGPPPWQQQYAPPLPSSQPWQPYGYSHPYGYPQPGNTNGFCIASLVLALAGIVLWFVGPVLGLVFGWVGIRQTARLGEGGRSLAIAGIVIGVLMLVINIALVVGLATSGTDPISTGVTV